MGDLLPENHLIRNGPILGGPTKCSAWSRYPMFWRVSPITGHQRAWSGETLQSQALSFVPIRFQLGSLSISVPHRFSSTICVASVSSPQFHLRQFYFCISALPLLRSSMLRRWSMLRTRRAVAISWILFDQVMAFSPSLSGFHQTMSASHGRHISWSMDTPAQVSMLGRFRAYHSGRRE